MSHSIDDLNRLFTDAESVDASHFAEQRTNTLLYLGDHWKKSTKDFLRRTKDEVSESTKIQLTENHISSIADEYISNIVNQAPGCTVVANNENELADQKDAELSLAVMHDGEKRQNFDAKVGKWAHNFVVHAECFSFTYWNPVGGDVVGYRQKSNEAGEPLFNHPEFGEIPSSVGMLGEQLEPVSDETKPVFEGDLQVDVVLPFNVLRPKSAETLEDAEWLCVRKMVAKEDAYQMFGADEDEDARKAIESSCERTYRVFNGSTGGYDEAKNDVQLKYFFFRKCAKYPKGYFYVAVDTKVLSEGEIPFGVYPIKFGGFRDTATNPRHKGVIRDLRHPQLELNRLVSRRALHSIVLGDDKIITSSGGKLQKGSTWSGIREFTTSSANSVTYLPGRDGSQFTESINHQVQTLYKLGKVEYLVQDRQQVQDPQAKLFESLRQRAKFTPFAKKFERFLVETWEVYLELAKNYFDESRVIMAVGKREAINVAEFKNSKNVGSRITVKPMNTDIESMMGKQLNLTALLQYAGKDMPKEALGRVIRMMPFLNKEQIVTEFTLTDENIDSDILAMDRGEYRPPRKGDDHAAFIRRLEARQRQNDYALLPPQVHFLYDKRIQEQEALASKQAAELKALQSEFIPTDGALITCSIHLPDPAKPGATRQLRVPYSSLMYLVQALEKQGAGQEQLEQMNQINQINILNQANQTGGNPAVGMQQPPGMPPMSA